MEQSEYILPLDHAQATLDIVGGKGASLARLAAAGLPVPGGFHVTTAAYKAFVAQNDLQPRILKALETVKATQPATLGVGLQTVTFLSTFMPSHAPIVCQCSQSPRPRNRQRGHRRRA